MFYMYVFKKKNKIELFTINSDCYHLLFGYTTFQIFISIYYNIYPIRLNYFLNIFCTGSLIFKMLHIYFHFIVFGIVF